MVKRQTNCSQEEPEQKKFELPSEKEHLLQVVEVFDNDDNTHPAFNLDDNTVMIKLEVCGGEEEGRTLLCRVSLDSEWKGFFATRLFLKAIGEAYKGVIEIDTDRWIGRQMFAEVVHTKVGEKTYANISEYNFDKKPEQPIIPENNPVVTGGDVAWDE